MVDEATNTEATEVVAEPEKVGVSLRESLEQNFDGEDDKKSVEPATPEEAAKIEPVQESTAQEAAPVVERTAIAPPADMRKEEREAFLNPTAENAHILQSYLSRRSYETRSDYARRTQELEAQRQQVAALQEVMSQYEPEYVRHGMNMTDVARRAFEWDKAMATNPTQTALEWLHAYGVSLESLAQHMQNGGQVPQQQQNYLTKEEAEQIAQERIDAMMHQQQQSALAYHHSQAVDSFISSKPLFRDPGTAEQLEAAMAPIVQALAGNGQSPQEILETAYNYVTKGNPTFSALAQQLEAPQVVETKAREAEKAKRATKSISGSAGSGTPRIQTSDLRDNLRRNFYGGR